MSDGSDLQKDNERLQSLYDLELSRVRKAEDELFEANKQVGKLQAKIARARAELVSARKGMGGLARISFAKHIADALKILEEGE